MNADRLLAHYEQIADAPDAVPRLRRFILDLAVRGKLVDQDSADEPASELLKRIAAEKAQQVRAGEIRKTSLESPISPNNTSFSVPTGWTWNTMGGICSKTGSGSTPRGGKEAYKPSGVVFLRSQNVYDDGLRLNDVAYIDQETHERMSGTAVETSDLLLNITGGSIGRCCLVSGGLGEANISQHVAIIRTAIDGSQQFLHCLVLSPYFQAFISDEQTGAGRGGLPKNKMDRIPVPLPPLAEQHRIVAKVDELMELCDRLEVARAEREATRDRLATASLVRLDAPDPDPSVFQGHATFALDNLAPLTTRLDQIKALRQAILNLAVRGKLVKQDPADEPASELLQRIAREKAKLVVSGKFKTFNGDHLDDNAHFPFLIPANWTWCYLDDLGAIARGGSPRPISSYLTEDPNGIPWIKIGDSVRGSIYINNTKKRIRPEGLTKSRLVYPGDLLLSNSMSFGYPYITNIEGCIHDGWLVIRTPETLVDKLYLHTLFLSSHARQIFSDSASGAVVRNLNTDKARLLSVPLPPLAEQHRIVATVDELMALCDQLEINLGIADTGRQHLLESLLRDVLVPSNEPCKVRRQ